MKMLRIGPSGNCALFYETGHKHTYEEAEWLRSLGLTAFEYSFGRGVAIGDAAAEKIRSEFSRCDIEISAHAPYYTNFANASESMIEKSIGYIAASIVAIKKMGGNRVVFHPASCGEMQRADAVSLAKRNIGLLMEKLREQFGNDLNDCIICPETMGKLRQIGRVEEILDFCTLDERLYPCFDFGHINSYLGGGLKTYDDYRRIIELTADKLGDEKTANMHVHFSKIKYGESGEIKHLTFEDNVYGPDYEPLAKVIDEYKLTPYIVCESDGTQVSDALIMKNFHKND
ncbi:TIM barrel protein [Pumilibacter intestinalis]|uniref:TIM barrel protein n=1 Tax=Pumilibacter intestinalis TaxID=2941511 RepID=UPI00203B2A31|nr:TIM barrel protein [Pumilibacter intestinalis]